MGAKGEKKTYIIKDGILDSSLSLSTVGFTRNGVLSATLVDDSLRFAYSKNGQTGSRTTSPLIMPNGKTRLYVEVQSSDGTGSGIYVTVGHTVETANSINGAYQDRVYSKDVIHYTTKTVLEIDISSLQTGFYISFTLDTWTSKHSIYLDVFNVYME